MESILYLAALCKYSYRGFSYPGFDFSKTKTVEFGSSKMVMHQKKKILILCVTGTDSIDDMILDSQVGMVNLVIDGVDYGKVHRGFLTYILKLWPTMVEAITTLLDEHTNKSTPLYRLKGIGHCQEPRYSLDEENSAAIRLDGRTTFKVQRFRSSLLESLYDVPMVIFTGHSLGACCAIAALMSVLQFGFQIKVRCVTFGAPKLGDRKWVQSYHRHVVRNFRVVHNNDVVSMLPFGRAYKHLNNEVRIGSNGGYLIRHKSMFHLLIKSIIQSWCKCASVCFQKDRLKEKFITDHKIDRYIEAVHEMFKVGQRNDSESEVAMTIGSIERMNV